MPTCPTALAVADAVATYRQRRGLTRDELSYLLDQTGCPVGAETMRKIESGLRPATVDELVALALVLEVSVVDLLSHEPAGRDDDRQPIATGIPRDVTYGQLRAWLKGETSLDRAARLDWCRDQVASLRIAFAHHSDQLAGAQMQVHDLGPAVTQTSNPAIAAVLTQVQRSRHNLQITEKALTQAQSRLDEFQQRQP